MLSILRDQKVGTSELGEHARVGSAFKVQGEKTTKVTEARDGDIVAIAKIDAVKAGHWLGAGKVPPPIEIDWRLSVCNGVYKISDIVTAGVNMAVTQRSEFAQVIQRNGGQVESLLSIMRERVAMKS